MNIYYCDILHNCFPLFFETKNETLTNARSFMTKTSIFISRILSTIVLYVYDLFLTFHQHLYIL
jgi:hypothetical protein